MGIVGQVPRELSHTYNLALAFFNVDFDEKLLDTLGPIDHLLAWTWTPRCIVGDMMEKVSFGGHYTKHLLRVFLAMRLFDAEVDKQLIAHIWCSKTNGQAKPKAHKKDKPEREEAACMSGQ